MLLTGLVVSLLSSAPCTLWGKIELKKDGKPQEPGGRVALYIDKVPATAFRRLNTTHQILQSNSQFRPQVLVVFKGDSVEFINEDKWEHSVFSNASANTFVFPRTKRGLTGVRPFLFQGPVRIQCDIHPEMRADVLVAPNPFFTLAEPGGAWKISGLPEGDYTLVAWEPNGGGQKVAVPKCAGPTKVVISAVEQGVAQKPRRRSGEEYREY